MPCRFCGNEISQRSPRHGSDSDCTSGPGLINLRRYLAIHRLSAKSLAALPSSPPLRQGCRNPGRAGAGYREGTDAEIPMGQKPRIGTDRRPLIASQHPPAHPLRSSASPAVSLPAATAAFTLPHTPPITHQRNSGWKALCPGQPSLVPPDRRPPNRPRSLTIKYVHHRNGPVEATGHAPHQNKEFDPCPCCACNKHKTDL